MATNKTFHQILTLLLIGINQLLAVPPVVVKRRSEDSNKDKTQDCNKPDKERRRVALRSRFNRRWPQRHLGRRHGKKKRFLGVGKVRKGSIGLEGVPSIRYRFSASPTLAWRHPQNCQPTSIQNRSKPFSTMNPRRSDKRCETGGAWETT